MNQEKMKLILDHEPQINTHENHNNNIRPSEGIAAGNKGNGQRQYAQGGCQISNKSGRNTADRLVSV
jgi:hypothetical protein